MSDTALYGCIEAGGTKFVLGVAREPGTILRSVAVPTGTPTETIDAALAFFTEARAELGNYAAFGIASFGPVDLDRRSPGWGRIIETPKIGWSGVDLVGPFARAFNCPVGFDTDVNGAILAESLWGAAAGEAVAVYVTVGTGIGGGAIIAGHALHGARHPEMGHILPARHPDDVDFPGICPFHGACLEGLASGPAIKARWGASLSDLGPDHPAQEIVAFYLAQLVIAQQALLSPHRIVFGGGVTNAPGLLDRIRRQSERLSGGYFGTEDFTRLIVAPALGEHAGLLGGLALALKARP